MTEQTLTTVEQLRATAQEALEKAAEIEREERRIEQEKQQRLAREEQQKERAAEEQLKNNIKQNIINEIQKLIPDVAVTTTDGYYGLAIDNIPIPISIDKRYERQGYSCRLSYSGRYNISIQPLGYSKGSRAKLFPPKADNSHSYDKIAQHIVYMYQAKVAELNRKAKAESIKELNQPLADAIRSEFQGIPTYDSDYSITVTPSVRDEGMVVIKIPSHTVTPEIARQLLTLLGVARKE